MKRSRKLDISLIVLFIIEIFIIKYFYSQESLLHFQSLFWLCHESVVLGFLLINYFFFSEDIAHYDIFMILFPGLGVLLLLLECFFDRFISEKTLKDPLFLDFEPKKKETKKEEFTYEDFDVMSSDDLLASDNIKQKKKFLFSFQTEDIAYKVKILQKALLDDDIDVIHYAATELNKIETKIQQDIDFEEKKGKDGVKIYEAYKKYIDSGLLFGAILDFYLERAISILKTLKKEINIDVEFELSVLLKKKERES